MSWPMAECVVSEFSEHSVGRVAMMYGFASVAGAVGTADAASHSGYLRCDYAVA